MAITVVLMVAFVLALIPPVVIGVYVYRDAGRRGMNAVLWTIVAMLAPMLIGFIVYLLVRSTYSDLRCPRCGAAVTERYAVCPRCGAKLRSVCRHCGAPAEPDWKVCPHCSCPLEAQDDVTPPQRPRDRSLWKVLAAAVGIPLALLLLLTLLMAVNYAGSGSTSVRQVEETVAYVGPVD